MELKLDLYRPVATDKLPATLPAMIFAFGGGFKKGSKHVGYIRDLCEHYAKRGYVAAAIDYRLIEHNPSAVKNPFPSPPGIGELGRVVNAAVQDTANAIRWLRNHAAEFKIDPNRIGIGGVSAGALNAMFAGHAEADALGENAQVAAVLCLLGPPGMEPSLIDAGDPPTFFGHGEKDKLAMMTAPYIKQLNDTKVYYEVHVAPGLGHRTTPVLNTVIDGKTIRDRSVEFCFKVLKLSELVKEQAAPAKAP
jgi:acetyl esterase/lipase